MGRSWLERDRNFSRLLNYGIATGEGTLQISRTKGQQYINRNQRTEFAGRQLDLVANLENVTDERYWAAAGDSRVISNIPLLAVGMPRTLRLSAKLSF